MAPLNPCIFIDTLCHCSHNWRCRCPGRSAPYCFRSWGVLARPGPPLGLHVGRFRRSFASELAPEQLWASRVPPLKPTLRICYRLKFNFSLPRCNCCPPPCLPEITQETQQPVKRSEELRRPPMQVVRARLLALFRSSTSAKPSLPSASFHSVRSPNSSSSSSSPSSSSSASSSSSKPPPCTLQNLEYIKIHENLLKSIKILRNLPSASFHSFRRWKSLEI